MGATRGSRNHGGNEGKGSAASAAAAASTAAAAAAAAERARIGAAAEAMAAAYFEMHGCRIAARNLRVGGGEIDLVVTRGAWMLLVEVRCRSSEFFGTPAETVRGRKVRALGRAARALLSGGMAGSSVASGSHGAGGTSGASDTTGTAGAIGASGATERATCWRFDIVTVSRRAQGIRLDHYPGAVAIEPEGPRGGKR
ncbi:MAG: YraN family protein [Candidatus Eisenbacteria bacterium]